MHAANVSDATGKQDKAIFLVVADNAVMGGAWDLNEISCALVIEASTSTDKKMAVVAARGFIRYPQSF